MTTEILWDVMLYLLALRGVCAIIWGDSLPWWHKKKETPYKIWPFRVRLHKEDRVGFIDAATLNWAIKHRMCPIEDCGTSEVYDGPAGGLGIEVECANGHMFLDIQPVTGLLLTGGKSTPRIWEYLGKRQHERPFC